MKTQQLDKWFSNTRDLLENAYIMASEPWKQSGFSGPYERWESLRKPVADCIDTSGTFLDLGCANGYLLECCMRWCNEKGIEITPYGLDISKNLLNLAKERLPKYSKNLFHENAFYWTPPFRFDFVRTELVYVPGDMEKRYIQNLLDHYLKPNGKLLIANYAEEYSDVRDRILPGCEPTVKILDRLDELGFIITDYRDGHDFVKGRKVRIAVVKK